LWEKKKRRKKKYTKRGERVENHMKSDSSRKNRGGHKGEGKELRGKMGVPRA